MRKRHYRRSNCRQCNSNNLTLAIKLKETPLANSFVRKSELNKMQTLYPLDVYFCNECKHLQLIDVIDPVYLYKNYLYVSGTSNVFIKHFQNYFEYIRENYFTNGLVIDIGSNDGTLMKFFKNDGYQVIGIEPAEKIANEAIKNGIPTLIELFSKDLARKILYQFGSASVITANNVFAHIDDPKVFLEGIKTLIKDKKGIFIVEVSYLLDVIKNSLFDTIYHEHLDYHSIISFNRFFENNGFEIFNIEHVDSHGGSVRIFTQLKRGQFDISDSVVKFIKEEKELGLDNLTTYLNFSDKIKSLARELNSLLRTLKSKGKTIVGYGAPAKATTLLHHFDIGSDILSYIVDDSKWKQNLYTPGMHIPIVSKQFLQENKPDYILILAWNFSSSIIKNNMDFHNSGGKFIIPLPKIEVI
ncbi:class I SAM-dependent methyltransferase [Prochlorococcus marinus]|uniref:class I SAM-dependent methyltransferase n=1 Tax=Prochlorococcus marinus TaxID=1219 RepID=UPI0022B316C8|nr:class I SAM-dependent methyltransferase [Prochlorococcus marinus]